jgi:hypothetical protein
MAIFFNAEYLRSAEGGVVERQVLNVATLPDAVALAKTQFFGIRSRFPNSEVTGFRILDQEGNVARAYVPEGS